jgi:hypothetical protein
MTSKRKGPNVHVVPAKGARGFVVKVAGDPQALSEPASQRAAISAAIPLAVERRSEVVIHRRDGRIRDKDSYGPDSLRVRDRKH